MKKLLIALIVAVVGVGGFFIIKDIVTCKHEELGWKVAQVATCTNEGIRNQECLKCGKVMQSENLPRLDHDWVYKAYQEPTCAEYGWEAGMACSACDTRQDQSKRIDKLPHTVVEDALVEAKCLESGLTAGSHCGVCEQVIEAQQVIPAKGHSFVMETNQCSDCKVKEYDKEIKSVNEFCEGIKSDECVVFLEYAVSSNQSDNIIQTIPANCKYIRLIGNANRTYPIVIHLQERSEPFKLDLVNTSLKSIGGNSVILSDKCTASVEIGFYGEVASIESGKSAKGSSTSYGGYRGENGYNTVAVLGDLTINVQATQCKIFGGEGGNGGDGTDATIFLGASSGGDGGTGGMAISANSIIVNLCEDYTKANITIAGGNGGKAGYNGSGGNLWGKGPDGVAGEKGIASNVEIVYQDKN